MARWTRVSASLQFDTTTVLYSTVTASGSNVTINVGSTVSCFRLVLTASAPTILAPVASASIPAGAVFSLYLDQDSTGGRPLPAFTGGANGFASDTASQIGAVYVGKPNTRTRLTFRYHGSVWCLDSMPYSGGAIS